MEKIRSIRLRWQAGNPGGLAYELSRLQFSQLAGGGIWEPAMNAYQCDCSIRVCFDLAGVDKAALDLRVEPRRLTLRGVRPSPEPAGAEPKPVRILAMEIDHGPFARELRLPMEIEPDLVTAEQRNGFLWVSLPLRKKP